MIEIIPTVVPASFDDVVKAKNRYGGFSPALHVDCADGFFAPNKTWIPMPSERLPDAANIIYEAHLMIDNPLSVGLSFARAGAKRIIGHVEAFQNAESARETFDMWHRAGATEVGVAILLDTSLQDFVSYIQLCDFVLIMTIEKIGKQGADFDERSLARVEEMHRRYPQLKLASDGGIGGKNISALARAGVTRFCVGAALAKSKDPQKEYSRLLKTASAV